MEEPIPAKLLLSENLFFRLKSDVNSRRFMGLNLLLTQLPPKVTFESETLLSMKNLQSL